MAKKKADGRKPCVRVETVFSVLTPKDWRLICRVPWTKSLWPLIGHLIVGEGGTNVADACDGAWSRVMQANRLLIKHHLPFRIRRSGNDVSSGKLTEHIEIKRVIR